MAGFANILSGYGLGSRRFRETLMRILVAARARQVGKTELPVVVATALPVAILARYGGVSALQGKAGRLMIPNAERGRAKAVHRMAALAAVGPRRG